VSKQAFDPTDQDAAEQRVTAFSDRGGPFVAAVAATRMPMVVTDPTVSGNPIIYVNAVFLDLFGYSLEEVLGQAYFFLVGENTDPLVEKNIRAANTADRPLNQEVLLYAKSGREVWAAQFVSPVHDDRGAIEDVVDVGKSLSQDRKRQAKHDARPTD
jgi:PAS domain S-box-containing protein